MKKERVLHTDGLMRVMMEMGDIFIEFKEGQTWRRIAKRGHPGTPHATKWVNLDPDYVVRDGDGYGELFIEKAINAGTDA